MIKRNYIKMNEAGAEGAPAGGGEPAAQPAQNGAFYSSFADEGVRNWAESKGFKDAESVTMSAFNLEKLIGFDKAGRTLVMPNENSTPEEIKAYNAKLGVPDSVDGYKLPVPEGVGEEFSKTAASWFHENGVTPKAAEGITAKWNEYVASQQQAETTARAEASDREYKEWEGAQGSALAQNLELGKRAVRQFGLDAKDESGLTIADKIETAIGTKSFMELVSKMGGGLGEHKVHMGEGDASIPTPAIARQKIEALKSDKAWVESYLNGDAGKAAEMQKLNALAYPEATN